MYPSLIVNKTILRYILGGIHMSGNSFLPTAILKHLSGTDQNRQAGSFFSLYQDVTLAQLDQQQAALYSWEYIQHGVVTFWVDEDDFDTVATVTDIRYVVVHWYT